MLNLINNLKMRAFFSLSLSFAAVSQACPKVSGFIDMNCDGQIRVVFTGDSIVYGRGDYSHHNHGGYPSRVQNQFPEIKVINFGLPGFTSARLLRGFKHYLTRPQPPVLMRRADIVSIDVGRNDWWKGNVPPGMVVRNIQRLVKLLRDYYYDKRGTTPLIVVATLIPTTRPGQRGYVNEINDLLLRYRSQKLPVYLRFDKMDAKYLLPFPDQVHPNTEGYDYLGRVASRFLNGKAQQLCAHLRPDLDLDGIFDIYEEIKYHTDPKHADTDGDSYSDGDEVFTMKTDPLDPLDPPPVEDMKTKEWR